MTVQGMDICLNVSAEEGAGRFRRKEDESGTLGNTVKKLKIESLEVNRVGNGDGKQSVDTVGSSGKRVKQKSLSAIVAKRLSGGSVGQGRIIGKQCEAEKESSELKDSQCHTVKSGVTLNKPSVHKNDPSSSEGGNESVTSDVRFAKLSKESLGKIILAKRRDVTKGEPKKSLSDIFSKSNPVEDKTATVSTVTQKADRDEDVILEKGPDKSVKQDKRSFKVKGVNRVSFKERKIKSCKDKTDGRIKLDARGKVSSLFGNNPEVPNIGQRLVKPVNEPVFAKTDFSDLDIHPYTISNLEQTMQITKMTTVQQKAIPQILSGKDVLIRSQTGSGKTLAYALPIIEVLQKIRPKLNRTSGLKALVVVPTRELALQTYECFLKLTKPFTRIVPGYLTGGEKRKTEKARLRKGCNILVATPGRLLDHIQHTKALKLNDVKYLILDEADRMLDMGYEKDVSEIINSLKSSLVSRTADAGYDAMRIFKQTVKKVFTEEEIALEEQEVAEERNSFKSQRKKFSAEDGGSTVDQGKSESPENRKKRTYHSGTDSESEEEDFPAKSKKTNEQGTVSKNDDEKSSDKKPANSEDITESSNRQTILLSATLTQAVEKLAGLTMQNPIFVDAAKENLEISNGDVNDVNEDLIVPQSVVQSYIVTPPKLRMVTLSAYIAGKCQSSGQHKILVFMATQDMVDYHIEILPLILSKSENEEDDSDSLVDVEFFKLCGSMTQRERTDVFKTFRQSRSGVLLCTDVAARGLDLPKVDCVIQYTGPLSTRDYVHRIGRTARAGSSGFATIFLTPAEIEFVRLLESRRIRIKQENMNDVLDKLLGPLSRNRSSQAAATSLQNEFETSVVEDKRLWEKACKAYVSWVRFYSSYPHDMRQFFNRRKLHLGHYAKSFALRDRPQRIGGIGKALREKDSRPQHENRLSSKRYEGNDEADGGVSQKKRQQRRNQDDERRTGLLKRVRMLNTSEYGSGLEPAKKPKKS